MYSNKGGNGQKITVLQFSVTAALNEPLPGYVDNLNGPTGLLLGAGKGVLRSMHCKPAYKADLIPVDLACNGLIVIAWHLANERQELIVYSFQKQYDARLIICFTQLRQNEKDVVV